MRDSDGSEGEQKAGSPERDLRRSEYVDRGVRVQRDLTGSSSFLALGAKTHFSKIHFSTRAVPHDAEARVDAEPATVNNMPESKPGAPASVDAVVPVAEEGTMATLRRWLGA